MTMATMLISFTRMLRLGPEVSLKGSGGLVHLAALTAEVAFLHVFLRVVPRAAGVGHEDGQHEARAQAADEQPHHARDAEYQPGAHRGDDGQQRRNDHLALGALGGDGYAAFVVGFGAAVEDAFDFAELPSDFGHHACGGAAHGVHGQAAEQEGHHRADKHAREDARVHERDVVVAHEVEERGVV